MAAVSGYRNWSKLKRYTNLKPTQIGKKISSYELDWREMVHSSNDNHFFELLPVTNFSLDNKRMH